MITLRNLRWSNCFSYGENNEIDLSSNQLTQIVGTNGVGKSSIPLIIEEVLFNKNSKGIKKSGVLNRNIDSKSYSIELEFDIDNDSYLVKLSRASSAKLSLYKNGEDISSHTAVNTYKTIQSLLKLDFKTFSQLVYQSTNTSLQFLTATDTARKKFLVELLGLEVYVDRYNEFKELSRLYSSKVTAVESKIDTINTWLSNNKLQDISTKPIVPIKHNTIDYNDEITSLKAELANVDSINKRIEKNNHFKKLLSTLDIDYANSIKVDFESYDDLLTQKSDFTSKANAAREMAAKIKALSSHCPTCEQEISEDFKKSLLLEAKKVYTSNTELANNISKEIDEIKENNKLFSEKQKITKEFEDTYRSIDNDLPESVISVSQLQVKISELSTKMKEEQAKVDELIAANSEAEKHNARLSVILEQTDKFIKELSIEEEKLRELSDIYNSLEILKKAFSTNGLIAYKIENLVKDLESLVNSYLAELSAGRFTIEFSVEKDKLNVNVTDNGLDIDILELSSGELARVNTATLLAIRMLMSSISKSQINVLFLDEIINVLDDHGKEKLVEVLTEEEHLNTFIVSHQWSHPLLYKLNIVKKKGISVIENG